MEEYRVRIDPDDQLARELLAALSRRAELSGPDRTGSRILVLGGARSGKSSFAEQRLTQLAADGVADYIATSAVDPEDAEWSERLRLHRQRRPATWTTCETIDVAEQLRRPGPPCLVDCLALWLNRTLDASGAWQDLPDWQAHQQQVETELLESLRHTERQVVLVSNEVGSGVVPAYASARLYRDRLGRLNAAVAQLCEEVWLLTAGIPQRLK